MDGGAEGIRTLDLLTASQARSQLRHSPTGKPCFYHFRPEIVKHAPQPPVSQFQSKGLPEFNGSAPRLEPGSSRSLCFLRCTPIRTPSPEAPASGSSRRICSNFGRGWQASQQPFAEGTNPTF